MELCLNLKTEKARQYLNYFMHYINLLMHYKITPVVVFDGGNIPCKGDTENGRYRQVVALIYNFSSLKCRHKMLLLVFLISYE